MKLQEKVQILIIIIILIGSAIFVYKSYQYWLASIRIASKEIVLGKKIIPEKEVVLEEKRTALEEEISPGEEVEEEKPENLSLPQVYPVRDYEGKEGPQEEQISNRVYLSSDRLEQGDTLLIRIADESGINKLSGEFGSEKINFFKSTTEDWIAIVGIDAKKKPGEYDLVINFPDAKFEKELNVVKRNFRVTELVVTEELKEKGYTPSKIEKNITDKDNPSIYEIFQIYTPTAYFNRPFIYPLQKIEIAGGFGDIVKSKNITLQHLGIDIGAAVGTPVYAVNEGIVRFSEDLINYGKTIIIDHGLGIFSLYLHLNNFKVFDGELVKRGDIIGLSGNTGYSVVPHLHFSVKANGASLDPFRFIKTVEEKMGL